MIERFDGKEGRRLLLEAMKGQQLVRRNVALARALVDRVALAELAPGAVLIEEGAADNDLYFIVAGRVAVLVGGLEVGTIGPGQHVGEVALLDPSKPRSATVVAREQTVVAKITERDFAAVAEEVPGVWRALAAGLGTILSERNRRVADPNALRARRAANGSRAGGGTMTGFLHELFADSSEGAGWDAVLRPGAVVGRFELVKEIGRGGFGVVWEARDLELGREVAFKAMRRPGPSEAPGQRLLHEAAAAARLSHPNIVTIHDVGRGEYGPYLVLELLRGETLARRLDAARTVPAAEAVRVATEVAAGLAHAHEHGVVHRDLKPGNVFLCASGQVKLLDLGIALAAGRRNPGGGTPSYMAPEQQRGAPEDERSDVFALGVLLYRMLAGKLPFGGAPAEKLRAPPRLATRGAPGLSDLVKRMLAADPTARPRDAGAVLVELREIAARPRTKAPRPQTKAPRAQAKAPGPRGAARARKQARGGAGKGARARG